MLPPPVPIDVVAVVVLGDGAQPEHVPPGHRQVGRVQLKQLVLDPVVERRSVRLGKPTA